MHHLHHFHCAASTTSVTGPASTCQHQPNAAVNSTRRDPGTFALPVCADTVSLPAKRPRDQHKSEEDDAAAAPHSPKRALLGPHAQPPPVSAPASGDLDSELLHLANVAAAEAMGMEQQQQQQRPRLDGGIADAGRYHAPGGSVAEDEDDEEEYDDQAAAYAGRLLAVHDWGWCGCIAQGSPSGLLLRQQHGPRL